MAGEVRGDFDLPLCQQLALSGEQDALQVGWCEVTITREDTAELIYKNAFVTDCEVRETNVKAIVRDGHARWKIENENNNVLKTKGYHLEHNFDTFDRSRIPLSVGAKCGQNRNLEGLL